MAIRSLARASLMSFNDARLFMQSSSSTVGCGRRHGFGPLPYRNWTLDRRLPTDCGTFQRPVMFARTRKEVSSSRGRRVVSRETNERPSIWSVSERGGQCAMRCQFYKQSGQKDFFSLRGDQRTTPPHHLVFFCGPFSYSFWVVSFNG